MKPNYSKTNSSLVELWKTRPEHRRKIENKLLNINKGFILKTLKSYNNKDIGTDVLYNEICISIRKALEKFDISRNVKFTTYWTWWIKAKLNICFKKYKKELNNKTILNLYKHDYIPKYNCYIKEFNIKKDVNVYLNKLNKQEKNIITLHFLHDYTLRDIGNIYKLSRERIRQIKEKGLSKMREFKNNDDRVII